VSDNHVLLIILGSVHLS